LDTRHATANRILSENVLHSVDLIRAGPVTEENDDLAVWWRNTMYHDDLMTDDDHRAIVNFLEPWCVGEAEQDA
jgi:hypothetical protein